MTHLFLRIALGLMLAVSSAGPTGLATTGGIVLLPTWLLESGVLAKREVRQGLPSQPSARRCWAPNHLERR